MLETALEWFWKIGTKEVWHQILRWLATAFICVSAFFITVDPQTALFPYAFIGFLVGHIIWTVYTYATREWALLALNVFFVFLDSYGVIIRL